MRLSETQIVALANIGLNSILNDHVSHMNGNSTGHVVIHAFDQKDKVIRGITRNGIPKIAKKSESAKRKMTAKQKKAVSKRMKAYWAKQRAAK